MRTVIPPRARRIAAGALLAALAGAAPAQSGGDYDIVRSSVDGGGTRSSGGDFLLQGTTGQPDAGAPAAGGDYTLRPGFWTGATAAPAGDPVFADGFEGS